MSRYKFDDCATCRFRKRPRVCAECDYGEQFEDDDVAELDFDTDAEFRRAERTLTTDDDEPNFNPDDLIGRLDDQEDDHDLEDDE